MAAVTPQPHTDLNFAAFFAGSTFSQSSVLLRWCWLVVQAGASAGPPAVVALPWFSFTGAKQRESEGEGRGAIRLAAAGAKTAAVPKNAMRHHRVVKKSPLLFLFLLVITIC
jgi:hypothetical protein